VEPSRDAILAALAGVIDPELQRPVTELDMVRDVEIEDGIVSLTIVLTVAGCPLRDSFERQVEEALSGIDGIRGVSLSFAVMTPEERQALTTKLRGGVERDTVIKLPRDCRVIAVASGKGGVGKSTTAVNLALGLVANGISTGLLDADIYGPSMPRMLNVKEKPESLDGKALKPIERYGLKTMSIGYIVNEDTPMIWRGPMVSSALEQMLRDVEWGELDVLVVDMPPGTGDAQLTLAQRVALAGAVIVSTPQDIALVDARKGLNMFRKVAVPVLGFVENMSFYLCPHCGERAEIFGHGGAREEAEKLGVPFLGEVPLHLDIRTTSDSGHPIVVSQPDSPYAQIYKNIAGRVWKQLSANQRGARPAPRIVVR